MSFLSGLMTQPATLAIGTGLLAGVVTGGAVVASGVLSSPPPQELALVSCPQTGTVVAKVQAGAQMLVTARSADGAWLELYVGVPGRDTGWAPASALRFIESIDGLPIDGACSAVAVVSLAPGDTPTPTSTPETTFIATVAPTISLLPGQSPPPTPTPTPTPKPTPTPTPLPVGVTPTPFVPTPLPPPPTIPPPTPTPTPTPVPTPVPTINNHPPTASGLSRSPGCIDAGGTYTSSTVTVTATDPDAGDTLTLRLRLGRLVFGNQFYRLGSFTMTPIGGNKWSYTITQAQLVSYGWDKFNGNPADSEITFDVTAIDSFSSASTQLKSHDSAGTQLPYMALSGCVVG